MRLGGNWVVRIVFLACALASCGADTSHHATLIQEAKVAISKEAGSPASAEFRNVRVAPDIGAEIIGTVCGEVRPASDQIVDGPFRRFIYSEINDVRAIEGWVDGGPESETTSEGSNYRNEFTSFWGEFC